MRSIAILALAAITIFSVTSCDKENIDQRPDLPPAESMQMDFSDFSSSPAGAKSSAASWQNFTYSYLSVGFWNVYASLVSALPVAAYTHALTQTPEYLGDNTWEWSFEFPFNNLNYKATLTGERLNNEEFSMEMVIALAILPNEGTMWFDGIVRYDHTSANWTLYKEGTIEVLDIAWNKDFETQAADLTYTYTEPDQDETGSYIKWEHLPEEVYDAAYTVSMAAGTSNIEWNISTIEGRVKAPAHFEDEMWHCWDSHANGLADMECE